MVPVLALYAPAVLIVAGLLAIAWLSEKIAERMGSVGRFLAVLIKIFAALGFFIGILCIATGVVVWITPPDAFPPGEAPSWLGDTLTIILLIVIGIAQVLKPMKDVPWAALLGLVGGLAAAGIVIFLVSATGVTLPNFWLIVGIVFIIIGGIIFFIFKWIEDLLRFIGMVITFPLISIPLGIVAIIQGILIIFGGTLLAI
jgi:hypothetical protein